MKHRHRFYLALAAALLVAPATHAQSIDARDAEKLPVQTELTTVPDANTVAEEVPPPKARERGKNVTVDEIAKAFKGDARPNAREALSLFFGDITARTKNALGTDEARAAVQVNTWIAEYEKLDTRHLNNIEGWRQSIAHVLSGITATPLADGGEKIFSASTVPEAWVSLLTREATLAAAAMPKDDINITKPDLGPDPAIKETAGQKPPKLSDAQLNAQENALYKKLGLKRPAPKKVAKKAKSTTPVKAAAPATYRMDSKGQVTDSNGTYLFTYNATTKEYFWKNHKITKVPLEYGAIVKNLGTTVTPTPALAPKPAAPAQPKEAKNPPIINDPVNLAR